MHEHNKKDGSMKWMMILHIALMPLLIFWNKIPSSYSWVLYGAIGIFILAHFISMFRGSGGGCCGGDGHAKDSEQVSEMNTH